MTFEGPGIKKCHWILKPQPQEPKDRGVMPSIVQGKITFNAKFNTQIINLTHLKRPWCWERLKAGGEGDDRGWDGWVASPTLWTWVWVSSGSWWWTGKPGVLQSVGSQRVGHDWATELNCPWHCQLHIVPTHLTHQMSHVTKTKTYTNLKRSQSKKLETRWLCIIQIYIQIH